MFSNLASLLLGVAAAAQQAPPEDREGEQENQEGATAVAPGDYDEAEARLSVLEAEDDWLLVEAEEQERQVGAMMASMAVPPLTPLSARSRSHSLSSLPCALEDSWYVTPPPCFTSTGPVVLETSPLENLLIEHPSMSVYQRPSAPHHPPPPPRSASLSPPPSRARQPLAAVNNPDTPPLAPIPRPSAAVSVARQQQRQMIALHSAQKVQQKANTQVTRRSALERSNKAREVGAARNKRPRRADHMLRHSGANNNRKC